MVRHTGYYITATQRKHDNLVMGITVHNSVSRMCERGKWRNMASYLSAH